MSTDLTRKVLRHAPDSRHQRRLPLYGTAGLRARTTLLASERTSSNSRKLCCKGATASLAWSWLPRTLTTKPQTLPVRCRTQARQARRISCCCCCCYSSAPRLKTLFAFEQASTDIKSPSWSHQGAQATSLTAQIAKAIATASFEGTSMTLSLHPCLQVSCPAKLLS